MGDFSIKAWGKIFSIVPIIAFLTGVIFVQPASAIIYKWTDEQGKVHLTDDPGKVPLKFRTPEQVERFRKRVTRKSLLSPVLTEELKEGEEQEKEIPDTNPEKTEATDETGETDKAKPDKGTRNTKNHDLAKEVMAFFKRDINRYVKFEDVSPSRRNFRDLKNLIIASLPQKKVLVKKLANRTAPLFKEAKNYLKSSIVQDEAVKKISGRTRTPTRQLKARLKREASTKSNLIKKFRESLKAKKNPFEDSSQAPDEDSQN